MPRELVYCTRCAVWLGEGERCSCEPARVPFRARRSELERLVAEAIRQASDATPEALAAALRAAVLKASGGAP